MGLKVEDRGLREEKLKLFDETTRFVSSYKEAKIITLGDDCFQLSMLLNGTTKIYTYKSFEEAYSKYEALLKNEDKGFFV